MECAYDTYHTRILCSMHVPCSPNRLRYSVADDQLGRPVTKAVASSLPDYQRWLNFGATVPELQVLLKCRPNSKLQRNVIVWLH